MSSGQRLLNAGALYLQPVRKPLAAGDSVTLDELERQTIEQTIAKHDGNLTAVAKQLGITRQTLYNKIKRYGL
jgi:DNA-binding NtrC family response regulator